MPWRRDRPRPGRAAEPLWLRPAGAERSAELERALAETDLSELLAAINAKRAARGRAPLSARDVESRLGSEASGAAVHEADEMRAARDAMRAARAARAAQGDASDTHESSRGSG